MRRGSGGRRDGEFESYHELAEFLGKNPEEAVQELDEILYYVELMEKYREEIDASHYSSALESDRVHDWFVEKFVEGLKRSEEEILQEIREEMEAGG